MDPQNEEPFCKELRLTMQIFDWVTDPQSSKYVLQKWVLAASKNADNHKRTATRLRTMNICLQTFITSCTALSMLSSAISSSVGEKSGSLFLHLSYLVISLNTLATIAAAIASLQDPAGRRREHLIAENVWDNLGRDIAVYIHNEDTGDQVDVSKIITMQDFQRRIDNAETLSPP